jgi:hypothetical protein
MNRTAITTGIICLSALGCAADASSDGYVLVDPAARAAGATLTIDDRAVEATLPAPVPAGSRVALVEPRGGAATELHVEPGELAYVEGATASVSHLRIGKDVAADAVRVTGDEASVRELASRWGGATVSQDAAGWHLTAADVFGLAAAAHAPAHVLGVAPIALAAGPAPVGPRGIGPSAAAAAGRPLPATIPATPLAVAPSFAIADAPATEAAATTHVVSPVAFQPTSACPGVSGVWRGRVYSDRHDEYYDFTMRVTRIGSTGLSAAITAQFWSASPADVEPPTACSGDVLQHVTVFETAKGTTDEAGTMHLASTSWRVARHACGERVTDYSLDRFEVPRAMGASTADAVLSDDVVWQDGLPIALVRVSCM